MSALMPPARCTADLPVDLTPDYLVSELKLDGSRYVLYIGAGSDPYGRQPDNTLLSRYVSKIDAKHVDRTLNVPQITGHDYGDMAGTILDGEMFLTDFPTTTSVMGSGPAVAVEKQMAGGWLNYWVWDVMQFRGVDVRGRSLEDRRRILEAVVQRLDNPRIKLMPQWRGDHDAIFRDVVAKGGEGIIVKDTRMSYGIGWAKMKKSYEVSCFVSAFKPGNGKYAGGVGALAISVYDREGNAVEVGFASGFDDATRGALTEADFGRVVDVYAQEIGRTGRLRHPTFFRWRDEMHETDCTFDKLRDDLAKATGLKAKRWRGGG